jgi:uncharacterized protein (TIGR00369 family)
MSAHTPLEQAWLAEGFQPSPMHGPFVRDLVRLFARPDGEQLRFRLEIRPEHCNGYATAHGGFIATLADIWLAYNVYHRLPRGARIVTANLSVDYLAPAAAGDWLESEIDRVRVGSRLCHASGAIHNTGKPVAAMRATFVLLDKKD